MIKKRRTDKGKVKSSEKDILSERALDAGKEAKNHVIKVFTHTSNLLEIAKYLQFRDVLKHLCHDMSLIRVFVFYMELMLFIPTGRD